MGLNLKPISHLLPISCVRVIAELTMSRNIIKAGFLEKVNIPYLGCAQGFFPTSQKRLNKQMLEEDLQRFSRD